MLFTPKSNLRLTVSVKPQQFIHGCLDWRTNLKIDMTGKCVLRVRNDAKVIGQVCIELLSNVRTGTTEAWIFCFAIDPEYRGEGLGTELLYTAEDFIRINTDVNVIKLHAQKENEDVLIPFYEKRGYTLTGFDKNCRYEAILQKQV